MRRTTLVLGAGSSHFLGYPVGSQLRLEILNLVSPEHTGFAIQSGLLREQGRLHAFIDAFRQSQLYSIDSFLGRRPEFEDIGKRSIAAIILRAEHQKHLLHIEHEDHWYRYLLNRLCSQSIDNIATGTLSVVTFNYDRSLEAYLFQALQAVFNVDQHVAAKTLNEIPIVHVYGWLGSPIPAQHGHLSYASEITPDTVDRAARGILVIPEGRDDSETVTRSRQLLTDADQILFLGFGFDESNLSRLDSVATCRDTMKRASGTLIRSVYATCRGLTQAEASQAHARLGQHVNTMRNQHGLPMHFWSCGCLQLLRETQALAG